MGFDIVHLNLHKSFSQPHGGGGPARPIAVSDRIAPFLPVPRIVRSEGSNGAGPGFELDHDQPKSIGRLRGFQGNFGVFVRSYAYISSLGGDGLREASETAVLNANYLLAGSAPAAPASTSRSPSASAACTSSSSPAPRRSATSACARSTSPSACSTTASTRRRSTSRCSSTRR